MSQPRYADCRCGHSRDTHAREGLAPQCTGKSCTCIRYRPATAPERFAPDSQRAPVIGSTSPQRAPVVPTPSAGPTLEQIVAAGKRSHVAATRNLAERIEGYVSDLRDRIHAEREKLEERARRETQRTAARAEVERLERELAAAKAKLTGRSANAASGESTDSTPHLTVPCGRPGCDRAFATAQAAAMHRRRAHEGFNPNAAKAV